MNTKVDERAKAASRAAKQILADEFLVARAKILELAATLDRIDRGSGSVDESPAWKLLSQGLDILCDDEKEKAKRVQLLMSRAYDPDWKNNLNITKRGD
jgi:hypothetical protein